MNAWGDGIGRVRVWAEGAAEELPVFSGELRDERPYQSSHSGD